MPIDVQRYMVRGFPTIKYFGVDKDRPQDYESGRDEDSIITYAISMWEKYAPPAEVQEIVDQEVFVNGCMGHDGDLSLELETVPSKTLCIIAFLPHILDSGAEGRNAYLQVLTASAEAFKGRPFSFLWSEGGKQPALEANLEVGGSVPQLLLRLRRLSEGLSAGMRWPALGIDSLLCTAPAPGLVTLQWWHTAQRRTSLQP